MISIDNLQVSSKRDIDVLPEHQSKKLSFPAKSIIRQFQHQNSFPIPGFKGLTYQLIAHAIMLSSIVSASDLRRSTSFSSKKNQSIQYNHFLKKGLHTLNSIISYHITAFLQVAIIPLEPLMKNLIPRATSSIPLTRTFPPRHKNTHVTLKLICS